MSTSELYQETNEKCIGKGVSASWKAYSGVPTDKEKIFYHKI